MDGISNTVILLVAHGAAAETAWRSYRNIERLMKEAFPLRPVRWAFTWPDNTVSKVIPAIHAEGFSDIAVQPLFIAAGREYDSVLSSLSDLGLLPRKFPGFAENLATNRSNRAAILGFFPESPALTDDLPAMKALVQQTAARGESFQKLNMKISVGRPLLDSAADLDRFSEALINVLPPERKPEAAIVLMGHSNVGGSNNQLFRALAYKLKQRDRLIFTATLDGALDFDAVRQEMLACRVRKAYLMPLMIAAGNHALRDLAGDGGAAWRVILERDGIQCVPALKGLGEYDSLAAFFCDKLCAALV